MSSMCLPQAELACSSCDASYPIQRKMWMEAVEAGGRKPRCSPAFVTFSNHSASPHQHFKSDCRANDSRRQHWACGIEWLAACDRGGALLLRLMHHVLEYNELSRVVFHHCIRLSSFSIVCFQWPYCLPELFLIHIQTSCIIIIKLYLCLC